ncbi:hypothetical protein [Actinoplanes sp. L3-i22]|uniref:hypothetical protein n=1 Tax=Actinoplanes sp. L3-i22 TaxID=2836373 RepID=UPI001C850A0F|nr:hypothetical protein [Actinoplanes sp. L3-i22]
MGDQLKHLQSGRSDVRVLVDQLPQQGDNAIGTAPSMLQSGPLGAPEYRHRIGHLNLAVSWAGSVRAVDHAWMLKARKNNSPTDSEAVGAHVRTFH